MAELEILNLGADPHERGLAHGRQFPAQIRANMETYLNRFEMAGNDRETVLRGGHDWARRIKDFDEEYAIEMAGVAAGAVLPLEQIAVLNARYELTYLSSLSETRRNLTAADQRDGCTAFAALPEVTHDGGTLIGQNWDWLAEIRGQCFVMRVRRPDRPNFICLTQAGIVGGMIGLNESGLGLCVNGLISDQDGNSQEQRPFHMRVRDIMNARNMNEAIKAVLSSNRNTSANFLIGHADGEVIDLERHKFHAGITRPLHSVPFTTPAPPAGTAQRPGRFGPGAAPVGRPFRPPLRHLPPRRRRRASGQQKANCRLGNPKLERPSHVRRRRPVLRKRLPANSTGGVRR